MIPFLPIQWSRIKTENTQKKFNLGEVVVFTLAKCNFFQWLQTSHRASLVAQTIKAVKGSLQCGRPGSVPGSGRSPGQGNGTPLQYSCLENSTEGGAWWATAHRVAESRTRLSDFSFTLFCFLFSH